MREQTVDVLVAGYPDLAAARVGFAVLCGLVRDGRVMTEYGVILVAKDLGGTVTLAGAGDHTGRQGLRWSGGVGVLVGLFSPSMLASIVLGGAAGGRPGRLAGREPGNGVGQDLAGCGPGNSVGQDLGGKLTPGTAAIIAVVGGGSRLAAGKALAGVLWTSVVPVCSEDLRELKDSLAGVTGGLTSHRAMLLIPGRSPGAAIGHTVSQPAAD